MRINFTKKQTITRLIYMPALTVLTLLFISGCSGVGNYTPNPLKARGVAKNVNVSNPVVINNAQASNQDHLMGFRGISINYNTFTQSVVEALNMELNNNMPITNNDTSKQLHITVTNVTIGFAAAGMNYRAHIEAQVKTGQGQTKHYQTTRASYASGLNVSTAPTRPLNSAFRDLVKQIAEDPDIQQYINN